jgi:hypothetical protein
MEKRRFSIVAIVAVLLVAIFIGGLGLGYLVPRWLGLLQRPVVYNTATVIRQIQTVSELVTVKYVLERVVILEDIKWIAGLGESRVLLLAHGVVKGGIDLGKIKEGDVRISGKRVVIKLPPPQILEAYLDEKQTRVIERTTGLLRSFDKDLEQTARQNAVDDIRRAARTGGILKEADERARSQLTNLFKQMGFESVEFDSP